MKYVDIIDTEDNIFGDNIAYVQQWNFSKGNLNDESRIEVITKVASICYDNPGIVGKESLYNRLKAEAAGLPSSSFEFVPVLIKLDKYLDMYKAYYNNEMSKHYVTSVEKYGQWIFEKDEWYLLTNYRALLSDHDSIKILTIDTTKYYNTEEECLIIKKYSKTFLYKMDLSTSKQHNRHRISLQELSRRYVSGKKTEFEFYNSEKLSKVSLDISKIEDKSNTIDAESITKMTVEFYFEALKQGVKSQEARRILPQSMYTTIWSNFLPYQLDNYLTLRDDTHAQTEIRLLSQSMKRLLK